MGMCKHSIMCTQKHKHTDEQRLRFLQVVAHSHTNVWDISFNANWAIRNDLAILYMAAADKECHLCVIYGGLFYETVTEERGIIEVRQSYYWRGRGGWSRGLKNQKKERREGEIKANWMLDGWRKRRQKQKRYSRTHKDLECKEWRHDRYQLTRSRQFNGLSFSWMDLLTRSHHLCPWH